MGVIGTFGSFAAARMGIYASQASLNVTGNNIANINTEGYTRQSMDLVSLYSGGSDRYSNQFSINIGYGALCRGVSQARDPYLDIRFRDENSSVGAMDAKLQGLNEMSNILDEVGLGEDGSGVIEAQLSTVLEQLEILSRNVGSEEYDTLVRSSANTLTQLFNNYAQELDSIRFNHENTLKGSIKEVNSMLTSIQDLNEQIRNAGIHGDMALELRDQRNMLIDNLSSYIKIDVTYTTEPIDQYSSVEKLVISLADTKPSVNLVDGIYVTQLEMPETLLRENPDYDPKNPNSLPYLDANGAPTMDEAAATMNNAVEEATDNLYLIQLAALTNSKGRYLKGEDGQELTEPTELGDNALYGSIQSIRELLTEAGEFSTDETLALDPDANIKRGIPYYEKTLDSLARKFAETFNKANQLDANVVYKTQGKDGVSVFVDGEGNTITDADGNPLPTSQTELTDAQLDLLRDQGVLKEEYSFYDGGPLFSTSSDNNETTGITAGNISISKAWSVGDVRILSTTKPDENGLTHSTRNDNINHMIALMNTKLDYVATELQPDANATSKYFSGTFHEYFASITSTLAADAYTTTALFNNYDSAALELDNDRSSVSGVDLNEEATNMMQFQKSYSAACRLLTTIDSILDKLINGTAV